MPVDPEKLAKAVEAARATWVKFGEQLDDVEALLNETPTDGQIARRLYTYFIAKWERRYGEDFIATPAKDMGQLTRIVKASSRDVDDLKARLDRYFLSRDTFYMNGRHSLALFIANINKFGAEPKDDDAFLTSAPKSCAHRPPCQNDQEHTQRSLRESRRA